MGFQTGMGSSNVVGYQTQVGYQTGMVGYQIGMVGYQTGMVGYQAGGGKPDTDGGILDAGNVADESGVQNMGWWDTRQGMMGFQAWVG